MEGEQSRGKKNRSQATMSGAEKEAELLRGHAYAWNQLFSFIKSMALKCTVELCVADVIHSHGGALSLPSLVDALGIPQSRSPCLRQLMRLLVHAGFFAMRCGASDDDVVYLSTELSSHLRRNNPASVTHFLLAMVDPMLVNPWYSLSQWFHSDISTNFEMVNGSNVWVAASKHPDFNNLFNEGMTSDSIFYMNIVVRECKEVFNGLKSIVDVGGGTGCTTTIIANAFPDLKCTVLDLHHVVANLKDSNIKFIGGDMFEAIPAANAVFLKWIIHDWNDEDSVKILKRCKEAIPSKEEGGKVIIVDMIVKDYNHHPEFMETQVFFDLLMMSNCASKERNEEEWHKIFKNAGFSGYKVVSTLGLRSIIEVYP